MVISDQVISDQVISDQVKKVQTLVLGMQWQWNNVDMSDSADE